LGAALRAFHAHRAATSQPVSWEDVVSVLAEPVKSSLVSPQPSRHAMYRELMVRYGEREAMANGNDIQRGAR
jgi:hypothetical protein